MSDLRTTNRLLAVIALCLLALVAKQLTLGFIPEAKAAPSDIQSVRLYGCSLPYPNAGDSQCIYRPVMVDGGGRLMVKGQ